MRPEIRVKQGVVLLPGHWAPHCREIIQVAAATAPNFKDKKLWITEGWRDIRDTLDMHELCMAFDFRCNNIQGNIIKLGEEWAFDVRYKLGPDFYAVAHGDAFHLHVEYDPR